MECDPAVLAGPGVLVTKPLFFAREPVLAKKEAPAQTGRGPTFGGSSRTQLLFLRPDGAGPSQDERAGAHCEKPNHHKQDDVASREGKNGTLKRRARTCDFFGDWIDDLGKDTSLRSRRSLLNRVLNIGLSVRRALRERCSRQ